MTTECNANEGGPSKAMVIIGAYHVAYAIERRPVKTTHRHGMSVDHHGRSDWTASPRTTLPSQTGPNSTTIRMDQNELMTGRCDSSKALDADCHSAEDAADVLLPDHAPSCPSDDLDILSTTWAWVQAESCASECLQMGAGTWELMPL